MQVRLANMAGVADHVLDEIAQAWSGSAARTLARVSSGVA